MIIKQFFLFGILGVSLISFANILPSSMQEWSPDSLPENAIRLEDMISTASFNTIKTYGDDNQQKIRLYRDVFGNSLLHYAAINNPNLDVIKYLIKIGINVNIKNLAGQTPLLLALKNKAHQNVILTLLKARANPNLKDKQGKTSFAYALENPNLSILQQLYVYKARSDIKDNLGSNVLLNAIQNPELNEDIIALLAKASQRLNSLDKKGYSPLIYAVRLNLPQRVETLIQAGANVNFPGNNGMSPLMHAASSCENQSMFEVLISNNANVYQRDSARKQAIDYASKYNNKVAIRVIGRQMNQKYEDDYDSPFRRPTVIIRPKPPQPKKEIPPSKENPAENKDISPTSTTNITK